MKRAINFLGWTLLASLLLCTVLAMAVGSVAGSFDPSQIRIGGEGLSLAWSGLDVADWLLAGGGIALALLIVMVVVPLAVLMPLAVAAVAVVGALLLVAGVLAMVFSPLIFGALVVWMIVRLVRRGDTKTGTAASRGSATIAG